MSRSKEVLELSGLKSKITELVEKINTSQKTLEKIKEWINGYNGKTIAFKTPEETFYLVFSDGVRLVDGEPSSFDMMLLSDEEILLDGIFNDPTNMRRYLKEGTITMWGNLHELPKFAEIVITSIM
ncbi:MAG: hypothetical protein ACETWM_15060 [Candidatus Lokiarchaeia archaeon]